VELELRALRQYEIDLWRHSAQHLETIARITSSVLTPMEPGTQNGDAPVCRRS
jgi:hypothetical protein